VQKIYLLEGKVQQYSWGGFSYIPQLLGIENTGSKPFAEYWLGAHPAQSSELQMAEGKVSLHDFIQSKKSKVLGERMAAQFGGLSFLLKVLDVRQMLSIQVHPNLQQGAAGFEKENAAGISLSSPQRNYKDANHKPELMVALSDFYLLHGFKPETQLIQTLRSVPEFEPLSPIFEKDNYKALFEYVIQPDNEATEAMLLSLRKHIEPQYEANALTPDSPHFWAARAFKTFCADGQLDKGIFSIYFFNLLHLKKGEGIFQDAGLPHAYLEGQNVEIMANSDNVLRAGLTDKHVNIPELLKLVRFEPTHPAIIAASNADTIAYASPAPEFSLTKYYLKKGQAVTISCEAAAILIVLQGALTASDGSTSLDLNAGKSCFYIAGAQITVHALEETQFFVATLPDKN
jgi:mannose-6-phosphate isomerase